MLIGKLLDNIQKIQIPNIFVSDNFRVEIISVVNDFFPKLNSEDKKVLNILTEFIINIISMKYGFDKTEPKTPTIILSVGKAPLENSKDVMDETLFSEGQIDSNEEEDDFEDDDDFEDGYGDDDLNGFNEYEY